MQKNRLNVISAWSEMQDCTGLWFCLEFGVSVRSSELDQVNPGSAGS